MKPILLTEPEAAEVLRICARTLRKARREGLVHYVLIGRAVRYTLEDLESYIAAQRQCQPAHALPDTKTRKAARSGRTAEVIPFHLRKRRAGRDGL